MNKEFATDIKEGLSQQPKRLYSKYFYDEKGDQLFQEIMKMEEYYLTRSEFEIFSMKKQQIFDAIKLDKKKLQLVEFGAGDGLKTKLLLDYLMKEKVDFEYLPIDISSSVLKQLQGDLKDRWPKMEVNPIQKSYFEALEGLGSKKRKLVLFLGSNIGNFNLEEANSFLNKIYNNLNSGDYLLIGADLKKDPTIILDAYNDKKGITKSFNLNLLARINAEFDANFELNEFKHYPTYDPVSGETKSYLVSMKDQTVRMNKLDLNYDFKYAEPLFMEISKKYSLQELEALAKESNFKVIEHFHDCKHYFVNTLWKK
ncbi:MAG: L-histidine N(alpha)-methyltransferase [Vicingaceae bacterium]